VSDALAATLPTLVAVSTVLLIYHFASPFAPGIVRQVPQVTLSPIVGIIAVIVGLAAVSALFLPRMGRSFVLRESGGAMVGGLVLAIVAGGYVWWNVGQRSREAEVGVRLLSARLAQVSAASLDVHRTTGMFAAVESSSGALALTTPVRDRDFAVYRADVDGLRGHVVAEIRPNGGAVYWESKENREVVATLVVGTVESATSDEIVVRGPGQTRLRTVPRDAARNPGDNVVAVVNPRTNGVIGVYPIATVSAIIPTGTKQ
jgi:hypothetical protein